jgi:exopolyphosphatase/guanosine-5'-triphosphate,3'-diphosphate pyrophosphatase
MKEYRVKTYCAVSTSGIREAENRDYVLEQIRLFTGLNVRVINNAEERFFMYKALQENLPNPSQLYKDGAVILNIGSGGVEVTVYNEGNLKFTEYIKVGSLRLHEILSEIASTTLDFPAVMEEFVDSKVDFLKENFRDMDIKNFIGLGGDLMIISLICQKEKEKEDRKFIRKDILKKLYLKIKNMTIDQIAKDYAISKSKAALILPSLIIFIKFLEMTKAEGVYAPLISLKHGILADIIDERYNTKRRSMFLNDIINSVRYIAKKYGLDEEHYEYVERLSLEIFDQTNRIHRLGERERLYLQIAAILHDVGKYVNLANHDKHCYNIISSEDILGFSSSEVNIVANIARYHGEELPHSSHETYEGLKIEDKLTVSKLASILKITEALDISHKKKVKDISISVSGKELIFKVKASERMLLEEWSFNNNREFFEEVMGYKLVLKCRE